MTSSTRSAAPTLPAIYIAVVQFLFVTTWTIYVIYLPRLLDGAGLPAAWAPRLLVLDQLVFMVADIAAGIAADRVQRAIGRLGLLVAGTTVLSCLAFLLLPHAAQLGAAAAPVLIGLMLVWTVTSSALRAPPWALLSRHAAKPALPWLSALTLIGLAAGGAVAPYLGVTLKNVDARLPFAISSLTLLAVTAGLVLVERSLARAGAAAPDEPPQPPRHVLDGQHGAWMLGILLLAAAFQAHFSLNAAAQYLRFATRDRLEWLMPVFWVGFGAATLPAGALCKRFGALPVMACGALLGAVAALVGALAGSLTLTIAAQAAAGAAWGGMLVAIFTSAAELGRSGREGLALGTMFAMFAVATIVRIIVTLAGWPQDPAVARWLVWLPVVLWALGGWLVTVLALSARGAPGGVARAGS